RGREGFLVELPGLQAAEALAVKQRIQTLGRLEMRIVVMPKYTVKDPATGKDTIERTFDIEKEKQLLNEWLNKENNKQRVKAEPVAISIYNHRERSRTHGRPNLYREAA